MKTAFKLIPPADAQAAVPASIFDTLEEAENALPPGYSYKGEDMLAAPGNYLQITEFTYPDLIADKQLAWDQAEIVKVRYYQSG